MNRTSIATFASILAILGIAPAARGDDAEKPPLYALSWSRSAESRACILAQDLARAVEHRLGRSVFTSMADASIVIDGRIEGANSGFAADIVVYRKDGSVVGQRHVVSDEMDCHAFDRSLSLVLALMIDPSATAEDGTRAPDREPADAPPTSAKNDIPVPKSASPAEPPLAAPAEAAQRGPAGGSASPIGSEFAAGIALGKLPVAAPGIETAARVALGAGFSARLGAALWMPERAGIAGRTEGAWLTLAALSVEACRSQRLFPALAVLACAGAEPGLLMSQGSGLDDEKNQRRATFDVVAGGRAAVRLGDASWVAIGAELGVPLVRDEFFAVLGDQDRPLVFRRPPVGGTVSLGLIFGAEP